MNSDLTAARVNAHAGLWDPLVVGRMHLPHRLVMAPMTRDRADADGTPGALAARYYSQRAAFGLIVSEGTQPSADGQGYLLSPGVYTDAHAAGWKRVADAVHARGAHLFIQLMHCGRMSHPDNTPHHRQPVAPSAIAPRDTMHTPSGAQRVPVPRALSLDEIQNTVADFAHAAACAVQAGADGVEIHGANGYLVQQFIAPNANRRGDRYGGSIANRVRFAIEVVAAVAARIGPERTGIRLSPGGSLGDIDEGPTGPDAYRYLVDELARLDIAYLHVIQRGPDELLRDIRRRWPNTLIVNRDSRPLTALAADVESGLADAVAVARWALANPDFPRRVRIGAALNHLDEASMFGGGAHGYIDYPTLP